MTASYAANYDAWGNLTTRTYNGTTGTQTYDLQDLLVRWNGSVGNKTEWYMYDGGGSRVLHRSFDGTTTTITVYAFGMEEHQDQYSGSGTTATTTNNTYYSSLGGKLLGTLSETSTLATTFLLTDTLGSVVASVSNTAGSASVLGNQAYGPYGNQRYSKGSLGTAKGYTGQYADNLTGLDYYNARYYDPVVGRFLSADMAQGNGQGRDPYAYVGGNPETRNDPTGSQSIYGGGEGDGGIGSIGAGGGDSGIGEAIGGAIAGLFGWLSGQQPQPITSSGYQPITSTGDDPYASRFANSLTWGLHHLAHPPTTIPTDGVGGPTTLPGGGPATLPGGGTGWTAPWTEPWGHTGGWGQPWPWTRFHTQSSHGKIHSGNSGRRGAFRDAKRDAGIPMG